MPSSLAPRFGKTITQHTTNPTIVEDVCITFFLPGEDPAWIPSGTDWVDLYVDADDLEDDRSATLWEAAEQYCDSIGVVFSQVIEGDEF